MLDHCELPVIANWRIGQSAEVMTKSCEIQVRFCLDREDEKADLVSATSPVWIHHVCMKIGNNFIIVTQSLTIRNASMWGWWGVGVVRGEVYSSIKQRKLIFIWPETN